MHTVVVIVEGLILLALCLLVARILTPRDSPQLPVRLFQACKLFIAIWLVCALAMLWNEVAESGATLVGAIPPFLFVFGVPAAIAAVVGHRSMRELPL